MTIPPVVRAAFVNREPADAFAVFTDEIGAWWPLPTHGLFGDKSGSVVFRDGQLIEQSVDGSVAVWGQVLSWDEPSRLVIAWHPGRNVDEASEVEVTFEPDGAGTRVTIEHRGWETFGDDATNRRLGYVGPNAWGYVLDHYADGAEPRQDPLDTSNLVTLYQEFFAEAEQGGFGPAPCQEWNAEQVVAHVALNDAAMLAVFQSIVHQQPARFENQICQEPHVLARWIGAAGDMSVLIARGRTLAHLVVAAIARLSPEQLQTEVSCHLTHDGEVMVDRAMPWVAVAVHTQAAVHLPAHVEQLRNLR